MATDEFSKFAGILSAALPQHHLLGFEIAHLDFHPVIHASPLQTNLHCPPELSHITLLWVGTPVLASGIPRRLPSSSSEPHSSSVTHGHGKSLGGGGEGARDAEITISMYVPQNP